MKRIIHISDPHVMQKKPDAKEGARDTQLRFMNLVAWMKTQFTNGPAYVVVITGDLVDGAEELDENGVPINYKAVEGAIKELRNHGCKILIVPGNHDYRRTSPKRKKLFSAKKYPSKDLDPVFQNRFMEGYDPEPPWVYDQIPGITFLGLNSMLEELDKADPYAANGKIGIDQMERLAQALDAAEARGDKKVVYLHHHPLNPVAPNLELKDSKELVKCLKSRKVDALLFGHNHLIPNQSYDRLAGCDALKIPFAFDAGSATLKQRKFRARGYCIEIDLEQARHRAWEIKYKKNALVMKPSDWRAAQ